jgi:hypothetical protein
MQVILPKQNKLVQASNHKKKIETIKAEVVENNVGAEENKNMEGGDGTATSVNNTAAKMTRF